MMGKNERAPKDGKYEYHGTVGSGGKKMGGVLYSIRAFVSGVTGGGTTDNTLFS